MKEAKTVTNGKPVNGVKFISPVFWLQDGSGAFQRIGDTYNLYDKDGDYFGQARSFESACKMLKTYCETTD